MTDTELKPPGTADVGAMGDGERVVHPQRRRPQLRISQPQADAPIVVVVGKIKALAWLPVFFEEAGEWT